MRVFSVCGRRGAEEGACGRPHAGSLLKKQNLYLLFDIRNDLLKGMLVPCFGQVPGPAPNGLICCTA